jgi:anti-sigma B factor antagonist
MSAHVTQGRRAEDRVRPQLLSIDLRAGRITAVGDLDRAVAHRLGDALDALGSIGHRTWTLDAAGISFCDAEGLRALAAGAAKAESRGCTLRLVDAAPFIADLLRLVDLGDLLGGVAPRNHGRSPVDAA